MTVTSDDAFEALLAYLSRLASAHPVAWLRRENGVIAAYSGVPVPSFNGVIAENPAADVAFAARMLDEIGAAGTPFSVTVRSDDALGFIELAGSYGLTERETVPLMVLESPTSVIAEAPPEGLSIRELTPDESDEHVEAMATCFEIPIELGRQMLTGEMFRLDGVRTYLGEFDGKPVATALGASTGDAVGVFNVGTFEQWRGKGFGRALTVRVIADGVTDGAGWSYLQSSAAGFPVYRSLGFETVEEWSRYVATEAA